MDMGWTADLRIDAVLVLQAGRADVAFLLAHEARRKLCAPCKENVCRHSIRKRL